VRMRVRRGRWAFSTTWAHGDERCAGSCQRGLTTAARAEGPSWAQKGIPRWRSKYHHLKFGWMEGVRKGCHSLPHFLLPEANAPTPATWPQDLPYREPTPAKDDQVSCSFSHPAPSAVSGSGGIHAFLLLGCANVPLLPL
jgi:hypothetical protein